MDKKIWKDLLVNSILRLSVVYFVLLILAVLTFIYERVWFSPIFILPMVILLPTLTTYIMIYKEYQKLDDSKPLIGKNITLNKKGFNAYYVLLQVENQKYQTRAYFKFNDLEFLQNKNASFVLDKKGYAVLLDTF